MSQALAPTNPLYNTLGRLRGLNLRTGPHDITIDCDPKHIDKRLNTLLVQRHGILVLDTVITRQILAAFLLKNPGITQDKITELLDPSDPQNVPRAVSLLLNIICFRDLDRSSMSPLEQKTHSALCLLAEVLAAFLLPFIDLTMGLGQQLRSLVKYAHLIYYLYHQHRTSFITSQLYIDSQTVVKSIIFNVAKQQLLDESQPFYIIHEGTDRIEVMFADARSQDHARNFDIIDLSQKLAVGALIHALMLKHPEWDRGHRRLKYFDNEGPDHVNPRSVTGNVISGDVSIQGEWAAGVQEAMETLRLYGLHDAAELFAHPSFDLFCPVDHDKIVGVSATEPTDISLPDVPASPELSPNSVDNPANSEAHPEDPNDIPPTFLDDITSVDLEGALEASAHPASVKGKTSARVASTTMEVRHADGRVEVYDKESVVRCAFTPKYARKSLDRCLRVMGVARDRLLGKNDKILTDEVTDPTETQFLIGDPVATLLRCGEDITIAIVTVLTLNDNGRQINQLSVKDLGDTTKSITLTGQVLRLIPIEAESAHENHDTLSQQVRWVWNNEYVRVQVPKGTGSKGKVNVAAEEDRSASIAQSGVHHTAQYQVKLLSWLCLPVSPTTVPVDDAMGALIASSHLRQAEGRRPQAATWLFSHDQLLQLTTDLWDNSQSFSEFAADIIEEIPMATEGYHYPYRDFTNHVPFTVKTIPEGVRVKKLDKNATIPCFHCGKMRKLKDMRTHVGGHILLTQYNLPDESVKQPVGVTSPCGFCGRDGCSISLRLVGKKIEIRSDCPYHYDFSYKAAIKTSGNSPSTNVPLHCPLCVPDPDSEIHPTFWKYNLDGHLLTVHQDADPEQLKKLTGEKKRSKHISIKETTQLGIPEKAVKDWRLANNIPNTSDIENSDEDTIQPTTLEPSKRATGSRKRAGTESIGGTRKPSAKRGR